MPNNRRHKNIDLGTHHAVAFAQFMCPPLNQFDCIAQFAVVSSRVASKGGDGMKVET
jgi:hypothetical protein